MPEPKVAAPPETSHRRPWLPWPNLLLAGAATAVVGMVLEEWNRQLGWPLGRKRFPAHAPGGGVWLASTGLVWALSLLSARAAALWWLARGRPGRAPGIRRLVLTATLSLIPQLGADLCMRHRFGWYTWADPRWQVQGLVLDPLPGWWIGHGLALAAALPALLDKHPHPRLPPLRAFLGWVAWNGVLLLACFGRADEATWALLLAPFAVTTVCAFHAGYALAIQRAPTATSPSAPDEAARDPGPEGPSA